MEVPLSDAMLGRRIGQYRLLRRIGQGGMGTVYEATHEAIGGRAAVKVLLSSASRDPGALERFFNEAVALRRIQHPGLVQVHDWGQLEDGTAYITREYLTGETLGARLQSLAQEGKRLPLETALRITKEMATALTVGHTLGVVHRDLKPDNVFLVPDSATAAGERSKILDFGIAKFMTDSAGQQTTVGLILGTPKYMSPEQCEGTVRLTEKVDVYALGVMLYEMVAGRPPFEAEVSSQWMRQHMFKEPPPLLDWAPNVPLSLHRLIHDMLIKPVEQRPGMQAVLNRVSNIDMSSSRFRVFLVRNRRPVLISAAAAGCAMLLLAGMHLGLGHRPDVNKVASAPVPAGKPQSARAEPRLRPLSNEEIDPAGAARKTPQRRVARPALQKAQKTVPRPAPAAANLAAPGRPQQPADQQLKNENVDVVR